ncbi:cell division protein FtsA [Moraxella bovoculi]|uniref:cell division protein FtsA n=1 Tax=Moraxella bovoculi TaxID=386891 RepID=UPI0006244260|nr:cell division protein FtsA [Moraxella bovoculi]AKG14961.2 hypothetical protein AAX08_02090 [Moraxella bovoculi]
MSDLQVALHLSSTAVYTVVGYATGTPEQPKIKVSAVGLARTDAFVGGKIERREHLLSAVYKSLQEAGDMAGVNIHEVCLSFASPLMISMNDMQKLSLHKSRAHTTVQQSDLYRAKELIADKLRAEDYTLLQSCQLLSYLDGVQEVKDPIGMHANEISVANHVMALPANYHAQILDVVNSAEASVGVTLFDGVVSAEYALTKEEKERGVCFIDIGLGTTKVCVYRGGSLLFSDCLDVGGQTVTFDIATELGLSVSEAESLKHQQGTVQLDPAKRAAFVTLKRRLGGESTVSLRRLSSVIAARYDDIFMRISKRLDDLGLSSQIEAGVVLAGGATQIDGLSYFVGRQWGLPVRMMTTNGCVSICPKNLTDDNIALLNGYLKDNKLHSVIGSLLYQNGEQFIKDSYGEVSAQNKLTNKVSEGWQVFTNQIKKWF